jgi:3',5'-cyclic-AMP phosphodiesterase
MTDHLVRFVHISDTHLNPDMMYTNKYASYHPSVGMNSLIEEINKLPFAPDFVLHTGDVAFDPVPEAYEYVKQQMARINYPVYYLVGNHDHPQMLQRILMGYTTDQPHLNYEFEVGGVQFAVLDSKVPGSDHPSGYVSSEQLAWLDSICSAGDDRPLVIAVHHNALEVGIPWLDEFMRMKNGEEFHQIIVKARHRVRGVFHGHIHQNIDVLRDGILYSSAASPWCQFVVYPSPESNWTNPDTTALPGFSIVSLTREQTYIRRHTYRV